MGFFKKLFGGSESAEPAVATQKNTVYAPLSGEVIPLEEIGDGVFSTGALGQGCGIRPACETVTAPFDGTIIQVAETKHAIGIQSGDGIELLIHVGLDTVAMNGKGFTVYVKEGDSVKCGQKLLRFSKQEIAAAGYPDVTAVLVTNSDDYQSVKLLKTGEVSAAEELMKVGKR